MMRRLGRGGFVSPLGLNIRVVLVLVAVVAAIVIPRVRARGGPELAEPTVVTEQSLGFFGGIWVFMQAHWILSTLGGLIVVPIAVLFLVTFIDELRKSEEQPED